VLAKAAVASADSVIVSVGVADFLLPVLFPVSVVVSILWDKTIVSFANINELTNVIVSIRFCKTV
jgi:hypothetical protein